MNMFYKILFCSIIGGAFGANILFITVLPSPSHHIWNEVLVESLLAKGHNITLMGYRDTKIQSKNYTVIKVDGAELLAINEAFLDSMQKMNIYQKLDMLWQYYLLLCSMDLQSNALNTLLTYPKDTFDLIVMDITAGQWLYPLVEHFGNPPLVAVSPFALPSYIADALGAHFYSYYPINVLPYSDSMTFYQRLENTVLYLIDYYLHWHYTGIFYKMSQEKFGADIVPFHQVENQLSILLANYDPLLDYPQPLPPHIIPVGGLHAKPAKNLSDELRQIVEGASEGVIYFSFGTNVDPSLLTTKTKQMFLKAFSKLRQVVLWKYGKDDLKDVPKNVIVRKWFIQNDVLGHENVKLFITHNGGLSTQEAMYHGVPMVGIPFFADQIKNAAILETKTLGKKLEILTLTEDILYNAIQEVLSNPAYGENIRKLSNKFRDRLQTPLERAVHWIEYVLRHKDVRDLSTRSRHMSLFERENLDVAGFILLCLFILIFLMYAAIKLAIVTIIKKMKVQKIKQN